ncbi:MAG: DUF3576 domain-containing protein [Alphaproteobacteria bacterium]
MPFPRLTAVRLAFAALALAACSVADPPVQEGTPDSEGFTHFGAPVQGTSGGVQAVNGFLWRASLETISFMPLTSADAYGGVVITEWYSPPETPNERFKVNIFVTGRQLSPEAVRAVVFRQSRGESGSWIDSAVDPGTARGLEDTILTRARQLRAEATIE